MNTLWLGLRPIKKYPRINQKMLKLRYQVDNNLIVWLF